MTPALEPREFVVFDPRTVRKTRMMEFSGTPAIQLHELSKASDINSSADPLWVEKWRSVVASEARSFLALVSFYLPSWKKVSVAEVQSLSPKDRWFRYWYPVLCATARPSGVGPLAAYLGLPNAFHRSKQGIRDALRAGAIQGEKMAALLDSTLEWLLQDHGPHTGMPLQVFSKFEPYKVDKLWDGRHRNIVQVPWPVSIVECVFSGWFDDTGKYYALDDAAARLRCIANFPQGSATPTRAFSLTAGLARVRSTRPVPISSLGSGAHSPSLLPFTRAEKEKEKTLPLFPLGGSWMFGGELYSELTTMLKSTSRYLSYDFTSYDATLPKVVCEELYLRFSGDERIGKTLASSLTGGGSFLIGGCLYTLRSGSLWTSGAMKTLFGNSFMHHAFLVLLGQPGITMGDDGVIFVTPENEKEVERLFRAQVEAVGMRLKCAEVSDVPDFCKIVVDSGRVCPDFYTIAKKMLARSLDAELSDVQIANLNALAKTFPPPQNSQKSYQDLGLALKDGLFVRAIC